MKRSWRWIAVVVCLVIVAGGSVGVLADRILQRDPQHDARARTGAIWFDCEEQPEVPAGWGGDWRERRLAEIQEELELDASQVAELSATMERHGELAHEFWDRTRRDYCDMRDVLRDDVRALLRDDQKPRFEERLERIDARGRARYSGRDGESRRSKQR